MKTILTLLLASLFITSAYALDPIPKTTSGTETIQGVSVQWCTQNGLEFDHTHILWVFHGADSSVCDFVNSPDYTAIKTTWRQVYGVVPPVIIAVSFGPRWTLSDVDSRYVVGAGALYNFFINNVRGYLENKLVGPTPPTKRWLMGKSMGSYNAALLMEKDGALFKKVVLGCPGLFTINPFSLDQEINDYVARNPGALRSAVDFGLDVLGHDYLTLPDWQRNDPLNGVLTATSPHLYVWYNLSDKYGFEEGARLMVQKAQTAGMTTYSYSNTGGHCLMDSTVYMHIANFLR